MDAAFGKVRIIPSRRPAVYLQAMPDRPVIRSVTLTAGPWRLRPWRADDAAALHALVRESMPRFRRWLPWCRAGYGLADAVAHIERCRTGWARGELYAFAVIDARTHALVASVGINQLRMQHRCGNLGYWVCSARQGEGIAPRIVVAAARFAFRRLGLVRLEIVVDVANRASRRVAEKAGAQFEGIARQRLLHGATARDAAIYALIPADLGARAQPAARQRRSRSS
jgi:RimJ/RimL family protein N-acetyltransferase